MAGVKSSMANMAYLTGQVSGSGGGGHLADPLALLLVWLLVGPIAATVVRLAVRGPRGNTRPASPEAGSPATHWPWPLRCASGGRDEKKPLPPVPHMASESHL